MNKKQKDSLQMIFYYNTFAFVGMLFSGRWVVAQILSGLWLLLSCYEIGKILRYVKK